MERRKSRRAQIFDDFKVYDHFSERYLGIIGDLSVGGFLLKGQTIVKEDELYHLGVLLPDKIFDRMSINFAAICTWSLTKDQAKQVLAGFQIVEIAEEASRIWMKIIEDYEFSAYEIGT